MINRLIILLYKIDGQIFSLESSLLRKFMSTLDKYFIEQIW